MSDNAYCWGDIVGVWQGWGGNGLFATARYSSESCSRYASDFCFYQTVTGNRVWILVMLIDTNAPLLCERILLCVHL